MKFGYFKDGRKMANLTGDIPAEVLKGYVGSYVTILTKILNASPE